MSTREVAKIFRPQPTLEGAGVRLRRAFSYPEAHELDPFLLFDDFSSSQPSDFLAGFPWHPHRGIETVTYIIEGEVSHEDSLGNTGNILSGEVQWMSAGSGIIHQEMPQDRPEGIRGFQLWVNLPKKQKMDKPRYQDVHASTIPVVEAGGARVRVITGVHEGERGPVSDVAGGPTYLDVSLERGKVFEYPVSPTSTVLLYMLDGTALVGSKRTPVPNSVIALLDRSEVMGNVGSENMQQTKLRTGGNVGGNIVRVEAPSQSGRDGIGARFLLIAGEPLSEPIAWHGPIVMNTQEELVQALTDLNTGNFIKNK
jgi:redox-sensitive bicupin YhaK (pirin superfamily)